MYNNSAVFFNVALSYGVNFYINIAFNSLFPDEFREIILDFIVSLEMQQENEIEIGPQRDVNRVWNSNYLFIN